MVSALASQNLTKKIKKNYHNKGSVEVVLEEELKRLAHLMNLGFELKVRWLPGRSVDREGEVKGDTIYIYAEDLDIAIDTLRHEFLDYVVCLAIKPYEKIVNRQRLIINSLLADAQEEAYREKERVVERLKRLLKQVD